MNSDSEEENPFAFLKENKNDPVQKSINKIDSMFPSVFDYYDEKKHPPKKQSNQNHFNHRQEYQVYNPSENKLNSQNMHFKGRSLNHMQKYEDEKEDFIMGEPINMNGQDGRGKKKYK